MSLVIPNNMNIFHNQHFDTQAVRNLLAPIDVKYPDGFAWLGRRLEDIRDGSADMWQITSAGTLVAVAIVTPKGLHRNKLSTFIVADGMRNQGLGSCLLKTLKRHWIEHDIDDVHVTVDERDRATSCFFSSNGFKMIESSGVHYSNDRRDQVLYWKSCDFAPKFK